MKPQLMPRMKKPVPRKQAHKAKKTPDKQNLLSAAVSINESLYLEALSRADEVAEGNFSQYARMLIRRDLANAKAA